MTARSFNECFVSVSHSTRMVFLVYAHQWFAIIIIPQPWSFQPQSWSPQRLGCDPLPSWSILTNPIVIISSLSSAPISCGACLYARVSKNIKQAVRHIARNVALPRSDWSFVRATPRTAYKCMHARRRAHVVAGNLPSMSDCLDPANVASSLATAGSHWGSDIRSNNCSVDNVQDSWRI